MNNWPVIPLREAADIAAGITLGRKTTETDLVEVPYLRVANVQDGKLALTHVKTVPATRREIEKWTLRDGDLLLTEGGDLDKLGRGACWREQLPLCIHQNHIFRVRLPSDLYDAEFVSLQVSSGYGKAYFLAHAKKTTGIASINQQVLGAFPLFSPPLAEQREIAARLKAQLAEVETARQAAQVQLKEATALKTKVLESLFSSIPDWAHIGDAAKLQSGYAFKSDTFKTSGVRLLRNANILPGKVYWDDAVFLSETDSVKHPRYALSTGDVLISLDRPIISSGIKVARVGAGDLPALLVQRVGRFLIDPQKLDAEYLYAYLQTDLFISKISGHDQSLGVPHISPSQVEAIEMPLPDISVQRELSKQLNEVTRTWQVALAAMQSQASELSKLPKAILAQAFQTQGK